VRHGVDGWLVAPGSAAELARALEELDRPRLAILAEGARQARSRLTWKGYAEALEGLLERALG
jgi:glycosyltransferase involved in cell wall biosynthesis